MKDRKALLKYLTPIVEESKIYDNDNQFIEKEQNIRFTNSKVKNINNKPITPLGIHSNSETYSWLNYKPRKQRGKSTIQQNSNSRTNSFNQQIIQNNTLFQKSTQSINQERITKRKRIQTEGLYQQQLQQKQIEKNASLKKIDIHLPKLSRQKQFTNEKIFQNIEKNLDQKEKKIIFSRLISTLTLQQQQIYNQAKLQLFQNLFKTVPKQPNLRNEENIRKFAYKIHKCNPFFKLLDYLTVVQFIKNCDILNYKQGQTINGKNTICTNSMIILWGSVQIFNQNLRFEKVYQMGATLNQDYFFEDKKLIMKKKMQKIKALQNTGILQLNNQKLLIIKNLLVKLYLLIDLKKIQSIFKKNYLEKCTNRNLQKYKLRQDS